MVNKTAGRPSIRSPEIEKALEYVFSIGGSVKSACVYAGIGESTYFDWCNNDQAFSDRMELMRDKMVLKALETVNKGMDDAKTAQWYLEKRNPDFKNKQTVEHEGSQPVTIVRKQYDKAADDTSSDT